MQYAFLRKFPKVAYICVALGRKGSSSADNLGKDFSAGHAPRQSGVPGNGPNHHLSSVSTTSIDGTGI